MWPAARKKIRSYSYVRRWSSHFAKHCCNFSFRYFGCSDHECHRACSNEWEMPTLVADKRVWWWWLRGWRSQSLGCKWYVLRTVLHEWMFLSCSNFVLFPIDALVSDLSLSSEAQLADFNSLMQVRWKQDQTRDAGKYGSLQNLGWIWICCSRMGEKESLLPNSVLNVLLHSPRTKLFKVPLCASCHADVMSNPTLNYKRVQDPAFGKPTSFCSVEHWSCLPNALPGNCRETKAVDSRVLC